MKKTLLAVSTAMLSSALLIGGCTNADDGTKDQIPTDSKTPVYEPVTVQFAYHSGVFSEAEFTEYVVNPVKKLYPHITIEKLDQAGTGQDLNSLVTAGKIPDIYTSYSLNISPFIDAQLGNNIEELIKKHQIDLNRLQEEPVDAIKVGANLKYLIGLPIFNQPYTVTYNKSLFDRFGVAYLKDGMTWEEIRDVAVRLTRNIDGVQYYGLNPDNVFRGAYQLELDWIDEVNNKAVFQTQPWKELFEFWHNLYKVPGYPMPALAVDKEFNEGRLAIRTGSIATLMRNLESYKNFNWDVVTYPINSKKPGVGQRVDSYNMYLSATSKNKDAAIQVMSAVLSEEAQTAVSRSARLSILKDTNIQNQFGKNVPDFQGKNIAAFTTLKMAKIKTFRNITAHTIANNAFNTVLYNNKDINTALREADENMSKAIQEQLERKK